MAKQQTAVDWLIHNLNPKPITKEEHQQWWDTIAKAKQMERNQIEKSYSDGFDDGYLLANGENTKFDDCYLYYNETYEN